MFSEAGRRKIDERVHKWCGCLALAGWLALLSGANAYAASAWVLDPSQSVLTYQSVKKNSIVETNAIRNLSGLIEPDGTAIISLDLDSVDTGVDLRNVRMRFLFFETFKYPTATISAKVDPADFTDLPAKRRITRPVDVTLSLHGVEKQITAEVVVSMLDERLVSVASKAPVAVKVEDFGLLPAIEKLERAADVTNIVPIASVSFDFIFSADGGGQPVVQTAALQATGPVVTDAAKTVYSDEECSNRLDVLSKTGAIYFRSGSARLAPESRHVLDTVVDVFAKCPELAIQVSGHTDSDGSDSQNLELSRRRAESVRDFIVNAGVAANRLTAVGYGEARPVAANDSSKNKALNRRIEFSAADNRN